MKCGDIKSCKCLNYEAKVTKHGQARTKLYRVWAVMRNRCNNPNDKNYHNYGGRGIKVHPDWDNGYEDFYEWSKVSGYKEGLTLDRINVNGNYEPSNCEWITIQEQQLNKRTTVRLEYNGEILTIKEWSEKLNCTYNILYGRLRKYDYDLYKAIESLNI